MKVFVGTDTTPYCVQESVLTSISDYFVKAIENQHLGTVQPGTLTFPEDSEDAWKLLLHWKIKGALPDLEDLEDIEQQRQLVHLWTLGDKYGIPELQDIAMLELLEVLTGHDSHIDVIKIAFENTAPGSPLRKVMAEETVYLMREGGNWKNEKLDKLDGAVGFTTALIGALDELDGEDLESMGQQRLEEDESGERTEKWKEYMVAGGPKKHWIYD